MVFSWASGTWFLCTWMWLNWRWDNHRRTVTDVATKKRNNKTTKKTKKQGRPTKWIPSTIREEALKHKYRIDFQDAKNGAYSSAIKFGILKDVTSHMPKFKVTPRVVIPSIWTVEALTEEALKYKTRGDFRTNSRSAYSMAQRKGLLDSVCKHMPKTSNKYVRYTKESVRLEALKYDARGKFYEGSKGYYQKALRDGILDEICTHMTKGIKPKRHWTVDKLREEALKSKTRTEFFRNNTYAYMKSARDGILDEICTHMPKRAEQKSRKKEVAKTKRAYTKWTVESLQTEANKYETRNAFKLGNKHAYDRAHRRGLLDTVCEHMKPKYSVINRKPSNKYPKEEIIKEALKYQTRTEFSKGSRNHYYKAFTTGVLDEVCKHMPERAKYNTKKQTNKKIELNFKQLVRLLCYTNTTIYRMIRENIIPEDCYRWKKGKHVFDKQKVLSLMGCDFIPDEKFLTQQQLAKKLNVCQSVIFRNGEAKNFPEYRFDFGKVQMGRGHYLLSEWLGLAEQKKGRPLGVKNKTVKMKKVKTNRTVSVKPTKSNIFISTQKFIKKYYKKIVNVFNLLSIISVFTLSMIAYDYCIPFVSRSSLKVIVASIFAIIVVSCLFGGYKQVKYLFIKK